MPLLAVAVPYSGSYLVVTEPPQKADAALVLAGDVSGNRLFKGAELVKAGYAPLLLVSGPVKYYERNEADLAIELAVQRGWPASYFEALRTDAHSTQEEAEKALTEVRRRGVRRLLVVTSDFHTRRSSRIYRRLAPDLEIQMVAAPTPDYEPDGWWRTRQSRKTWLTEWQKMIADWMGGL